MSNRVYCEAGLRLERPEDFHEEIHSCHPSACGLKTDARDSISRCVYRAI